MFVNTEVAQDDTTDGLKAVSTVGSRDDMDLCTDWTQCREVLASSFKDMRIAMSSIESARTTQIRNRRAVQSGD